MRNAGRCRRSRSPDDRGRQLRAGNAGVAFYMDILMPLSAITLLFASKPEKA
jgi:hypothetical protein